MKVHSLSLSLNPPKSKFPIRAKRSELKKTHDNHGIKFRNFFLFISLRLPNLDITQQTLKQTGVHFLIESYTIYEKFLSTSAFHKVVYMMQIKSDTFKIFVFLFYTQLSDCFVGRKYTYSEKDAKFSRSIGTKFLHLGICPDCNAFLFFKNYNSSFYAKGNPLVPICSLIIQIQMSCLKSKRNHF